MRALEGRVGSVPFMHRRVIFSASIGVPRIGLVIDGYHAGIGSRV